MVVGLDCCHSDAEADQYGEMWVHRQYDTWDQLGGPPAEEVAHDHQWHMIIRGSLEYWH